jgi:spermidine/putrescine ABC transporter ATP-binding subunit
MNEFALQLNDVAKRFGDAVAVAGLSLQVRRGEFVSLLGPSGCGKTTTLRMIAGFVRPDRGRVLLDGEDVTETPPFHRDIGMVFQNYALFPHMTVVENVAFGLRRRGIANAEISTRVREALAMVRLEGLEQRKPRQISGGQQQRVALARAIVIRPRLLLFDEPLSNIDAKLRKSMQIELRKLQESLSITTIHVTHDQSEALSLSDRVVIVNHGRVEQQGPPREVYNRPHSVFVADFVGESNLLAGRIVGVRPETAELMVELKTGERLTVIDPQVGERPAIGADASIVARPELIQIQRAGTVTADTNLLAATVQRVVYTGPTTTTLLALPSGLELISEDPNLDGPSLHPGDNVQVSLPAKALFLIRQK